MRHAAPAHLQSNFRDIGGLQARHGRTVRFGQVYRSEALSTLAPAHFSAVEALGVRLVCDLRSPAEREFEQVPWTAERAPETLLMDVTSDLRAGRADVMKALRDDLSAQGASRMMRTMYEEMPRALVPHLRRLFERLLQESATPLVVHCTAGKDRTGVCCALLLLALDVEREAVVQDYLLTARVSDRPEFQANVARAVGRALGQEPPDEVVKAIATVDRRYLESALSAAEAEHGSIEGYLAHAGLDASRTAALRGALLTD